MTKSFFSLTIEGFGKYKKQLELSFIDGGDVKWKYFGIQFSDFLLKFLVKSYD